MANHRHEGFSMLPTSVTGFGPAGHSDPAGHGDPADVVDTVLIGRLVGASYDGCTTCVDEGLDRLITGFRPNRRSLYEVVAQMDVAARRSTAVTALDIIVSDLTSGGALDGATRPNPRATPW